jgi:drug/metabolite transporter (DMT)-like permease
MPDQTNGRAGLLARRFAEASPLVRGATWILLSGVFFALMISAAKFAGNRLDAFQVAFFRALFGLASIMPFIVRLGVDGVRTSRPWLQIARGFVGSSAMLTGFYAMVHLPLADVTAIGFANPLFMLVLAALFLGERVRLRRTLATIAGFAGVIVMLRPAGTLDPAALAALLSTLLAACSLVLIKTMARNDNPTTIVFYFGLFSTVISAVPAYLVWVTPTAHELVVLGAMGLFATAGQSCMVRAYAAAEATLVASFDYVRLIWACLFGYLWFGEIPDRWTLVGAAIIIASTLYLARRERALGMSPDAAVAVSMEPASPVGIPSTRR